MERGCIMEFQNTTIHTRLKGAYRISSSYRKFANPNFESWGWETLLWNYNEIIEEYPIVNSVDGVMNLHNKIESTFKEEDVI